MIWGFSERDVAVVFRRHKLCRNVPNPSGGPPLLGRSLCVQWGPRNRRSKMVLLGVFSHFHVKRLFTDVDKLLSSSTFLH